MGDLVTFSRAGATARSAPPAGASADILFFTGVRYFRLPDAVAVAPEPTKPTRRRTERAKQANETPCHA